MDQEGRVSTRNQRFLGPYTDEEENMPWPPKCPYCEQHVGSPIGIEFIDQQVFELEDGTIVIFLSCLSCEKVISIVNSQSS